MNASIAATALMVGGLIVLRSPQIVQADEAQPVQQTVEVSGCRERLTTTQIAVNKMPSGVEKMAAQKEIDSARMALDKGDEATCATHVHNARDAIHAK